MAQDPQNSLAGANAATATPQPSQAPVQLNPYKMQNQEQSAQTMGMPVAQSVNAAASNPNNQYAQGGDVSQATPDILDGKSAATIVDPKVLKATEDALAQTNALKPMNDKSHDKEMKNLFGQEPVQHKAKGGDVASSIKNMSLQDIVKLLASHPEVAAGLSGKPPSGQPDGMKKGGQVAQTKSANLRPAGLLSSNQDVPTYAQGGKVNTPPVPTSAPVKPPQQLDMASGGEVEDDNITGYGPDGTPIVQNDDGSQGYGDINQLLDRPESAPTLGTGQTPASGMSKNAANSVGGLTNNMAKGGEESGVPPGSLSHEVADDVPAKLSQGEFVFSADVVRYYGLKLLNQMMEHARGELKGMQAEGNIRSPGDGNNVQDTGSQFVQDAKPDLNTYDKDNGNGAPDQSQGDDDLVTGILKECQGGGMNEGGAVPQMGMAQGGGLYEDDFAKGGQVYKKDEGPSGTDNQVSSHPQGGSALLDYAKGGVVTSASTSLAPKKLGGSIPMGKVAPSSLGDTPKLTAAHMAKPAKLQKPASISNFKQGGLIKNFNEHTVPEQSLIGA